MASSRQKLTLDEQAFEGLLAAAYTIQQHNEKRRSATAAQKLCERCGSVIPVGEQECAQCKVEPEPLRPGEKLQRNWASMWLMSQDQEWRPAAPDAAIPLAHAATQVEQESPLTEEEPIPVEATVSDHTALRISEVAEEPEHFVELEHESPEENKPHYPETALVTVEDDLEIEEPVETQLAARSSFRIQDLAVWKRPLKLRFSRGDLYLVLAIAVAAVALFWVATGSTVAKTAPTNARHVHLTLWERTLVGLGLAEAPEPPVYRGDPGVKVWVDPHTALYYCSGEEEYGKTADGHYATQRDAQMDQFEPSARAACE
jgi:hypothetical protein